MKQRAMWQGRTMLDLVAQPSTCWRVLAVLGSAAALACGGGADDPAPTAVGSLSPAPSPPLSPVQAPAPSPGNASTQGGDTVFGMRPEVTAALTDALTTSVEVGDVPGLVALVVGRNRVLYEGAAGELSLGTPMPVNAIFNIASMTKPVTSVAAMMLVDQGLLALDDAVSKFLPGFDALQVLTSLDANGVAQTTPAQNVMTVRHLLSHTSGIGYAFANSNVARLQQSNPGRNEWELPLLNEPGARWNYSASTRVLGLIVEQLAGQPLESFFQEHIFQPLGMTDTSYAVPADKLARVPALHTRGADGSLQESPQGNIPSAPTPPFNGDGGLYSTAQDYGLFLRMLLNEGQLNGVRILSEQSVALMSQNQIGEIFVEQQEAALPQLTRPFPLGAGKDKFGLGFQLTGERASVDQRRPGSMAWAGLFNTEFWIDPQVQVAVTHLVQVLPFYDEGALHALSSFETTVYRKLFPPAEADQP